MSRLTKEEPRQVSLTGLALNAAKLSEGTAAPGDGYVAPSLSSRRHSRRSTVARKALLSPEQRCSAVPRLAVKDRAMGTMSNIGVAVLVFAAMVLAGVGAWYLRRRDRNP